jgi:hypothetical protein
MIKRAEGPIAGIEMEEGTRWLREHWQGLRDAGETELSFSAWARESGVIVSSDHGWDDRRRRHVSSLNALIDQGDDDRAPFDETRISPIRTARRR